MFRGKKIGVIIPAAGSGSRMKGDRPKQYQEIGGKPVVLFSAERFESAPEIDCIALVAAPDSIERLQGLLGSAHLTKVCGVFAGGKERQDSVWSGLQAMKERNMDIVVVHDAARPFVTREMIRSVVAASVEAGAAIVAVIPKDTIKTSNGSGFVESTVPREGARAVQTPQAFRFDLLYSAFERAIADHVYATDEAALVERLGAKVKFVEGNYDNIKITTAEDLELAAIIAKRERQK